MIFYNEQFKIAKHFKKYIIDFIGLKFSLNLKVDVPPCCNYRLKTAQHFG